MDLKSIIEIVVMVILGGATLYFKCNEKLNTKVGGIITEAENEFADVTKAGGMKHDFVVNKLYSLIPTPFKFLFSLESVEKIVDKVFVEVEEYAQTQLDKAVNKIVEDEEIK